MEPSIEAGEEARVLPNAPTKREIADDRIAVLPLQTGPAAVETIVLVHPSALLDSLGALFETLWDRALPFATAPRQGSTDEPTADERRLLSLLAAGLPDEVIARQLRVSPRTLQRRLRDLMNRLGGQTRFQAGIQAAMLGWIIRSTVDIQVP